MWIVFFSTFFTALVFPIMTPALLGLLNECIDKKIFDKNTFSPKKIKKFSTLLESEVLVLIFMIAFLPTALCFFLNIISGAIISELINKKDQDEFVFNSILILIASAQFFGALIFGLVSTRKKLSRLITIDYKNYSNFKKAC